MTKQVGQSRRGGRHDPRSRDRALALVPQHLPPARDEGPQRAEGPVGPVSLWLLSQPAPLGTEEGVQR